LGLDIEPEMSSTPIPVAIHVMSKDNPDLLDDTPMPPTETDLATARSLHKSPRFTITHVQLWRKTLTALGESDMESPIYLTTGQVNPLRVIT